MLSSFARSLFLLLGLVSCETAEARDQIVLFVDTDLPIAGTEDESVSPDATIDSIRIDVLDGTKPVDVRVIPITSPTDLPLSFGVPSDIAKDLHVRVRAFRAANSVPSTFDGTPTLDIYRTMAVDRLVSFPEGTGVRRFAVRLAGECWGAPIRFAGGGLPETTCISEQKLEGDSSEGLTSLGAFEQPSPSTVWKRAKSDPCAEDDPSDGDAVCIRGGFFLLGDRRFGGRNEFEIPAIPQLPVSVAPFYLDRTEMTVGALRDAIGAGYGGPLPDPREAAGGDALCTWDPASDADLPINCLAPEVAEAICAFRHGRLPTEAEWEFAARGRGEARLFPSGSEVASCCELYVGRAPGAGCDAGSGPRAVGVTESGCAADISRDGVVDMGGNVAELVADSVSSFSGPCWTPEGPSAILENPRCDGSIEHIARGASFAMTLADAPAPVRRDFLNSDPSYGFRCAFEGTP